MFCFFEYEVGVVTFGGANFKVNEQCLELWCAGRTYVPNVQNFAVRCKIWGLQWCFESLRCREKNTLVSIHRTESVYAVQAISACVAQSPKQRVSICNLHGDIWHLWMLTPRRVKITKGGLAFVYANFDFKEGTGAFSTTLLCAFSKIHFCIWDCNYDAPEIKNAHVKYSILFCWSKRFFRFYWPIEWSMWCKFNSTKSKLGNVECLCTGNVELQNWLLKFQ